MAQFSPEQLDVLHAYSGGRIGTRSAIEALGGHDYADLIIALAQNNLEFPKPTDTARHAAHLSEAAAILQPRLRLAH
jgi:hypothetical protein